MRSMRSCPASTSRASSERTHLPPLLPVWSNMIKLVPQSPAKIKCPKTYPFRAHTSSQGQVLAGRASAHQGHPGPWRHDMGAGELLLRPCCLCTSTSSAVKLPVGSTEQPCSAVQVLTPPLCPT